MVIIGQDWFTSSAIATLVASAINISINNLYRRADEKKRKRATLYYPLLFACKGLIQAVRINNGFDEVNTSHLFKYSAAILNEITYKNGSIIYIRDEELDKFEALVDSVNKNMEFFDENNLRNFKSVFLNNFDDFKRCWTKYCEDEYSVILDNATYFTEVYESKIKTSDIEVKQVIKKSLKNNYNRLSLAKKN